MTPQNHRPTTQPRRKRTPRLVVPPEQWTIQFTYIEVPDEADRERREIELIRDLIDQIWAKKNL